MANLKARTLLPFYFAGFCHLCADPPTPEPLPQSVTLPTLDTPLVPAMPDGVPAEGSDFTPPRNTPAELPPGPDPLAPSESQVPRWNIHVRLDAHLTYDDNIFIQPNHRQSDFYFGITPLIAAGWGRFVADPGSVTSVTSRFPQVVAREETGNAFLFRYAPTALLFVHHSDQNTVNQDVMAGGRWAGSKLTLEAAARFEKLTAPDIDVGNRIQSTVTSGFLNANYQMTEKTSLDARFALEHDSYQGGLDSTDLSLTTLLDYQVLPKTQIGIGFGTGYTTVESGQEQYYEQGLLHWRYEPTFKLTFEGTAGVEVRQIRNGRDHVSPVFEIAANYAALDATSIRLSALHHTEASALYGDQDIERTTLEVSIRQRFFQKVYLSLSGGYQWIHYIDAGATADRDDNYAYFGVEASMEVTRWLGVRAFYRHEVDDSSNHDFSFRRNLAELECRLQF